MKKTLTSLILALVIIFNAGVPALAVSAPITITFNNEVLQTTVAPIVKDNTVMVPLRAICEKFGTKISYIADELPVIIEKENFYVIFKVNGKQIQRVKYDVRVKNIFLDQPIQKINGTIYIPFKAIGEIFDAEVNWNQNTNTIGMVYDEKVNKEKLIDNEFKNPYTMDGLNKLVDSTPVDPSITEFRNKPNARRANYNKFSTKYFDIYYQNNDLAKSYIEEIKKYADTAYVFLYKMYGKQIPVEVYLINENDAKGLNEGDIRRKEYATFVYINDEHTLHKGNIIGELIHEVNHNFFHISNNMWDVNGEPYAAFINECTARMIPQLYADDAFKNEPKGYFDNFEFANFDKDIMYLSKISYQSNYYPNFNEFKFMDESIWTDKDTKTKIKKQTSILFWTYLFKKYGPDKFQEVLRNIGNKDVKTNLEKIYGKPLEDLEKEWYTMVKGTV